MSIRLKRNVMFCLAYLSLTLVFARSQSDSARALNGADQYLVQVKKLGVNEGFSSRRFSFVFQDMDGFIWAHSRYGLDRYDGIRVKHYPKKQASIRHDAPAHISQSRDGFLWLHYWSWPRNLGLDLFDPKSGQSTTIQQYLINPLPISERHITAVMQSKKGDTFLGTQQGQVFKITSRSISLYYETGSGKPIQRLYESSSNGIWIISKENILKIDDKKSIEKKWKRNFLGNESLCAFGDSQPNSFAEDAKGNLHYIQLDQKSDEQGKPSFHNLYFVNETQIDHPFDNYSVLAIVPKTLNRYVLKRSDDKKVLVFLSPQGKVLYQIDFADNHPIWVYVDKQQNLWVNGAETLLQITSQKSNFTKYLNDITSFYDAPYGARGIVEVKENLIVNGLGYSYQVDKNTGEVIRFGADLRYRKDGALIVPTHRQALEIDKSGNVWMTDEFFSELIKYDPVQETFTHYSYATATPSIGTKKNPYLHRALHIDTKGTIWLGHTKGVSYFDPSTEAIISIANKDNMQSLTGVEIIDIQQAKEGFWLLTTNGLFLFDPKTKSILAKYGEDESGTNYLPGSIFTHIHEDEHGVYWVATRGSGVIRWNKKSNKIDKLDKENGLSNNTVYAVYEDSYQNLWLPTDNGLNRYNKVTRQVNIYHVSDGIAHEEFNTNSHYRGADSTLYFGGLNGVTAFQPKDFYRKSDGKKRPIFVTELKLLSKDDGESLDGINAYQASGEIKLAPDYFGLTLEFSHLDFKANQRNFAYKIEGFDTDWTYLIAPQLRINSLPYGNYSLILKAQENNGQWTEKSIPLTILKPFYFQTWFLVLSIFSFFGLLVLLYKVRVDRLTKNKEELEYLVNQRTIQISEQANELQLQAIELKKLDKMKSRFFANISHEFRTPLTLIIGPAKAELNSLNNDKQANKNLETILSNANQLLDLINELLDLTKSENGKLELCLSQVEIEPFIYKQVRPFLALAETKNIQVILQGVEASVVTMDIQKISRVIDNILFNALKFSPEDSELVINTQEEAENYRIEIIDQGAGIPNSEKKNIFQRFHQLNHKDTNVGSGIGLALAKEYVELHGGSIYVENNAPIGSKFIVEIPLEIQGESKGIIFNPSDTVDNTILAKGLEYSKKEEIVQESKKQFSLLIVEDNTGVREFIKSFFENDYQVYEAVNGQEGIDLAVKVIPDLIISDVMMPRIDGVSMTRKLKEDMLTSHVPIILLTAKASLEHKVEGLGTGADDYLTKPFEGDELVARVKALISNRIRLREIYGKGLANEQNETQLPLIEQRFIALAEDHILESLNREDYDVKQLSEALRIERSTLYRKLKALTGMTPTLFIRTIRLKKAMELLRTQQMTISEIAFSVGFGSSEYFSKMFKLQYGQSPSEVTSM